MYLQYEALIDSPPRTTNFRCMGSITDHNLRLEIVSAANFDTTQLIAINFRAGIMIAASACSLTTFQMYLLASEVKEAGLIL